jgi:hypothetical protein
MPQLRNVFLLGRQSGAEDQLTEMLVWLASAIAEVGAAVVRLALGPADFDLAQLEASTQQQIPAGRLDALFRTESLVLVVESKLQSDYGEDQIRKYLDWLASDQSLTYRALMTLTANHAPWPAEDSARAARLGIVAAPRRWHELFTELSGVAADLDVLSARLVQEFLEMLTEEGLIPVKPLEGDELLDAWSHSWAIIGRYHEYFRACKDAIAQTLEASPKQNRSSAKATYIYQDFETSDAELIGVGLHYSDRELSPRPKIYRNAPILWLTIEADGWPEWESAATRLEASPPDGWKLNPDRSFEEQRSELATACGQARGWLLSARPPNYRAKRRRSWRT